MNKPARPLRLRVVAGEGDALEAAYACDIWRAGDLGVSARRGRDSAWFTSIKQTWLRDSVKHWCRFRLSTGAAFGTISTMAQGMARFSEFLDERHPEVIHMTGVTRALFEDYLSWMASSPWKTTVRSLTLTMLRGFLEWGHRYGQLPGLGQQCRALCRRSDQARGSLAPIRARVRHGPARVRGQLGPAPQPECPQPRRLAHGDRAAGR